MEAVPGAIPGIEVFLLVLLIFLCLFAAAGNALSIYIFGRMILNKHRQSTTTITRLVFLNLALTDLINGFICIPFSAFLIAQERHFDISESAAVHATCSIIGILFNIVSRTSIFLIAVISVDRFVALFYPNFYRANVRQAINVVRGYVAASWLTSIVLSILPYFRGLGYIYFNTQLRCSYDLMKNIPSPQMKITSFVVVQIIPTFLPFLVMVVTSIAVYLQIRKSIDKRRKQLARVDIIPKPVYCPPAVHSTTASMGGDATPQINNGRLRVQRISFVVKEHPPAEMQHPVFLNGHENPAPASENLYSPFCEESIETGSVDLDETTHGSDSELSFRRGSNCNRRMSYDQFELARGNYTNSPDHQPNLLSVGTKMNRLLHSESTPAIGGIRDGEKSYTAPNSRRNSRRESGVASPSPSLGGHWPGSLTLPAVKVRRLSGSVIPCTSQQSLTPTTPVKKRSTAKSLKSLMTKATGSVGRLRHKECKVLERRKRGAVTVLLVVLLFLLCYLTWFLIFGWVLLGFIDKRLRFKRHLSESQQLYLFTLFPVGAFLNSGTNPLVYYTRNTAFKKEVIRAKSDLYRWILTRLGRTDSRYQTVDRG